MRGDPQAVSARLRAYVPGRPWSSRPPRASRRPRQTPEERIVIIERLEAEERAARRSGRYFAEASYRGRRW
jgi:hypothetical protein